MPTSSPSLVYSPCSWARASAMCAMRRCSVIGLRLFAICLSVRLMRVRVTLVVFTPQILVSSVVVVSSLERRCSAQSSSRISS